MENPPKVSILIPVYNTAKYLPRCLKSVQEQTLKEIEIIAVNDASPDNAAEVLAEYAAKDSRIKVVTHEKNGGILAARLSGIAAAKGEFLIFLDADDFLDTDTARASYAKAKATGADMVHFCFDVKVGHTKKLPFAREVEKRLRPYNGTLLGRRVFEAAMVDNLYRWNICGKFIAADICRKAAAALPPGYYIMAEDFCFFSLMSWFTTHYEPLHKKCYHYGLDIGVSAYATVNYKGFIRNCSVFTALNAVRSFLTEQGAFEQYKAAFEKEECKILDDLLDRWEHKLIVSDRERTFSYMFDHYDHAGMMRSIVSYFGNKPELLAGLMGHPELLQRAPAEKEIKHVALCLDPALNGKEFTGILMEYAAVLQKNNISITVFTPENATVSGNYKKVILPQDRKEKVMFWNSLRAEHGIDTVIYGMVESTEALYDVLSIRLSDMNCIAVPFAGYSALADTSLSQFFLSLRAVESADAVGVLTEKDKDFFHALGLRTALISLSVKVDDSLKTATGKEVFWFGHPGNFTESENVISAWASVAADYPENALILAGKTTGKAALHNLYTLINAVGQKQSIRIAPFPTDLAESLKQCAACIVTSPDEMPVYAEIAGKMGIPLVNGVDVVPEILVENLRAALQNDTTTYQVTEKQKEPDELALLKSLSEERPSAEKWTVDFLNKLNSYCSNHEPYLLMPEPKGVSFINLFRKADAIGYKIMPAESKLRDFFFRGCRYVMKRLGL